MTRDERNAKLIAIGDWLATTPKGERGRDCAAAARVELERLGLLAPKRGRR